MGLIERRRCLVAAQRAQENDILYELPSETVFDGTNYIGTGVKLFHPIISWSIYIRYKEVAHTEEATIINAGDENRPWPGFVARQLYNRSLNIALNGAGGTNIYNRSNNELKIVLTRLASENRVIAYKEDGSKIISNGGNATFEHDIPVELGASHDANGNFWRGWKGTIYECKIYGRVLEKSEIESLMEVTYS